MKPKIAEIWEDACKRLRKAEQHLDAGKHELVESEAKNAAVSGLIAITLLLREDDEKTYSIALDTISDDKFFDWEGSCSCSRDYLAKAQKFLKIYSNLSPPENKLPEP